MSSITASPAKIIAIADREVGYHEGRSASGDWNNIEKYAGEVPGLEWANGQAWCAVFVSWCAMKAGFEDLYPRTASCDVAGAWFKQKGRWSQYPAIGAQVFFGTPGDLSHTGLVKGYNATTIFTDEGNTNDTGAREGDGVYSKARPRLGSNVIGYGYPAFPEGIVSADPGWAHRAPEPVPAPGQSFPNVDAILKSARAARDAAEAQSRKDKFQHIIDAAKRLGGK